MARRKPLSRVLPKEAAALRTDPERLLRLVFPPRDAGVAGGRIALFLFDAL